MASVTSQSPRVPRDKHETAAEYRGGPAHLAEFLGTMLLVFAIGAAASSNSLAGVGFTDFVVIGLVHAFTLVALVASLGRFSGGHFNPAVTLALLAIRKISPKNALTYIGVQLLGAVAAAGLLWIAFQSDLQNYANLGAAAPTGELVVGKDGMWGGMIFEGIGVFILVLAVLGTAVAPGGDRRSAPLTIGLALGVANLIAAPFTGGALNPARAFGPALIGNSWAGGADVFIVTYVLGPVVFGVLAAVIYNVLMGDERHREVRPADTLSDER